MVITSMRTLWQTLPQGYSLESKEWNRRHQGLVWILWLNAVAVPLFSLWVDNYVTFGMIGGTVLAGRAAGATSHRMSNRLRSALVILGLVAASSLFVHLSNGLIEAHFHFFVMMAVIVLYQDWLPFLLALLWVVVDHGVIGTTFPTMVYNHLAA